VFYFQFNLDSKYDTIIILFECFLELNNIFPRDQKHKYLISRFLKQMTFNYKKTKNKQKRKSEVMYIIQIFKDQLFNFMKKNQTKKCEKILKKLTSTFFFEKTSLIKGLQGIIILIQAKKETNEIRCQVLTIKSLILLKKAIILKDDLKEVFIGYLLQLRPLLKRKKDIRSLRYCIFIFYKQESDNMFAQQFWLEYLTIYEPFNIFLIKQNRLMIQINSNNSLIEWNFKKMRKNISIKIIPGTVNMS